MIYSLIGCGTFGIKHLKTLIELNKDIAFVCNKTESRFNSIKEQYPQVADKLTTDLNKVWTSNSDIVIIATEPHSHYELVKAALLANKHVICEKPLVFNTEECEELFKLANQQKRLLITHYTPLFSSKVIDLQQTLVKIVTNQDSYIINYINLGDGPDRKEYKPHWDYGSHVFAFLASLGQKPPTTQVRRFDSVGYNYECFGDNINNNVILCQFGNRFPTRTHGLVLKIPCKYLPESLVGENTSGSYTFVLKLDEPTIPNLYYSIEQWILRKENMFYNDVKKYESFIEFQERINLYTIACCKHIENSVSKNEQSISSENTPS